MENNDNEESCNTWSINHFREEIGSQTFLIIDYSFKTLLKLQ